MKRSVHQLAAEVLHVCDPQEKCARTLTLRDEWLGGGLEIVPGEDDRTPLGEPGRPAKPQLVPPSQLAKRQPATPAGHAALLHAIAHIEFNAINLALDCIARFRSFPQHFHAGWLQVAAEEAMHFSLLRERLKALDCDYGDFSAHDGLWEMARRTADDALARMALVPRVLEARGLDATPAIIEKLRRIGDEETIQILEIILRDEVGHVALGDHWFRVLCAERGLEPEATYLALMDGFDVPYPQPPLAVKERLAAGFTRAEIDRLAAGRKRRG